MKKHLLLTAVLANLIYAQTPHCLISYSKYQTMSKKELLQYAKHCKLQTKKNNLLIVSKKTTVVYSINKNNIKNTNKKPKNILIKPILKLKSKIKPKKIKKINIVNMNLPVLIKYAIKHNLTTFQIGKLIIQKSKNYSNLDINYITNIFSKQYTKQNLKQLLQAITKGE